MNVRCYAGQTPSKLAWESVRAKPNNQSARDIMLLLLEAGAKPDLTVYSDDDDSDFSSEEEEEEDNKNENVCR